MMKGSLTKKSLMKLLLMIKLLTIKSYNNPQEKNYAHAQSEESRGISNCCIKNTFEQELGLVVYRRRDGGFGNMNTGNVVRKAFADAEKNAAICGVPTMLV